MKLASCIVGWGCFWESKPLVRMVKQSNVLKVPLFFSYKWLELSLHMSLGLEKLHTSPVSKQINGHASPLERISCNKIHYHTKMLQDSFMSSLHCSGHWPNDLGFLTSDLWYWPLYLASYFLGPALPMTTCQAPALRNETVGNVSLGTSSTLQTTG